MELISHRGLDSHNFRENTLDAIIDSIKKEYISGVEFDVRLTKDNKIVLIHDLTINRVSDGSGFVSDMTLKQLQEYNFGTKENKVRITTLSELLPQLKTSKKILIEIKHEKDDYEKIVDVLMKIVKKTTNLNIYFCSFHYELLQYLKKKYPDKKTGIILMSNKILDNSFDFYLIPYRKFYGTLQKRLNDKEFFLWTVNNKKDYLRILERFPNVSVITDKATSFIKK